MSEISRLKEEILGLKKQMEQGQGDWAEKLR